MTTPLSFRAMRCPDSPGYWIGADAGNMAMMEVKAWMENPADLRVYFPLTGWAPIQAADRMYPQWAGPYELPAAQPGAEQSLLQRIQTMTPDAIRLLCGELTAQEMRTAKAILDWVARELQH